MPSADFSHAVRAGYPALSHKAHRRPPGVSTCLSVRGRRVYGHTLKWIEDFVLLCRLIPAWTPYTRFLCVTPYLCGTLPRQSGFLPKPRHRNPVAIPLYPSPPSGWVWDLPLTSVYRNHRLTLKNMCRARHTQKNADGQAADIHVTNAKRPCSS